jgi:hypothetical protein
MLRNPHIISVITQMSGRSQIQLLEVFEAARQSALHTLRYDSDERTRQGASREMRGWARVLKDFQPDRTLLPALEESTQEESTQEDDAPTNHPNNHPTNPATLPPQTHASQPIPIKLKRQPPKNQPLKNKHQQKNTPEKDQLPNGQPAFDIQLAPQPPTPPPPQKQIIEVRNHLPKSASSPSSA